MVASRNVLVVSLGLALGVGCSNQPPASDPSSASGATPPPTQPAVTPPPPVDTPPPAPQPSADAQTEAATTTTTTPSAPPEAPLTDEQIVAVLDAANKKEIDEATLAQTKAKHKDVKAYARAITQHHTQAKAKQAQLVKKLGITAAESDKSKLLTTETQQAVDQLKALQGADFDQQFVATMIQDHQKTLDLLDRRILQDAKNADLKTMIEKDLRPTIEKHLKDAEALAQKLGPAAGTTGGTGTTSATGTQGATGATGAGAQGGATGAGNQGTTGGQRAAGAQSGNQAGQTGVTAGSPGGQGGVQPPAATPAAGAGAGTKGAGTTK
ncbi:DUF4142 domain-containing protein [Sorangium cellulosum]|uniref:DUF4142 domain-containing protein n=1 Tax=Sorangium cellulosum TaxID=56 RepID=A0A150Q7V5_SORCE|nr:DUF4142 domain-containing protein [Sorangium cellulosum]KYF63943.1 hypothetical protein BE15_41635 [Sorangium cellulosum]